ncbi:MAG: flagellar basal body-associated FliL family protein [Planctomycetes bacterium]|nr:flagellar basal body-associated FliL family protein [Planctomycetota bacterium]
MSTGSEPLERESGSKKSKVLLFASLLLPLVAGAGLALATPSPPRTEEQLPLGAPDPVVHDLGQMIVNLAGSRGQRYLKIKASVELSGEDPSEGADRLKAEDPAIRDALIQRLSTKTLKDLEAVGAKDALRLEFIDVLNNQALRGTPARADRIFFTEFLIQ